jgi:hypothetical protein
MSNNLSLAQEFAWSLATSLMACVTLLGLKVVMAQFPRPSSMAIRPAWYTNSKRCGDDIWRLVSRV